MAALHMAVNTLRVHLAEFGVVAPQGLRHVERFVAAIEQNKARLPKLARSILRLIVAQWTIRRPRSVRLRRGWRSAGSTPVRRQERADQFVRSSVSQRLRLIA